ncbi:MULTISPECIES: hypothetical protein [unclassified Microcoleus]|uniref:hypothetical protein n=1 Tax=unclassified Microcoleus TaxID=2642155 RepID=UPI002FD55C08
MTEYQLTPAKYHHVQVVVSLNRVHLENYKTPDAALTNTARTLQSTPKVKNPVSFVGVRKSCTELIANVTSCYKLLDTRN